MTYFDVIDATWPAASSRMAGGFRVREGLGGGSRVSSASLEVPFPQADVDAAIAAHRAFAQQPKFLIRPGEDALDHALAERNFELFDPVVLRVAPVERLLADIPPVTAFAHWPPLAITREVWAEGDIGPARQAIVARATGAKAAILGRKNDRAAGAAFVAIHDDIAMLHGLIVLPDFRRQGARRGDNGRGRPLVRRERRTYPCARRHQGECARKRALRRARHGARQSLSLPPRKLT